MDFFYDGQIRRYVTQFMRLFIGFKYQAGNGDQQTVPVMYGDLTRQVANIIRDNSENKMPTVPRMACYITGLQMDTSRLTDPTFVSKVNIRERNYTVDEAGNRNYTGAPGKNVTVERLMPTPYILTMKADLWTSNTDQKLQLLEQILVLFNPSFEIQTNDNYVDWTSLSVVYLTNQTFTSRSIPAGTESDIDICSLDFEIPVWISPPAKVKKLGIVRSIIANIFTEDGDVKDISSLVYNGTIGSSSSSSAQGSSSSDPYGTGGKQNIYTNPRYPVLLFKANNGQDYDYELSIVDQNAAIIALNIDEKEYIAQGKKLDWNGVTALLGGFTEGTSMVHFRQPNGNEISGTCAINPTDPFIMLVSVDPDSIPANTAIPSAIRSSNSLTTIDAIIDPTRFNPIEVWNGVNNIPLGTRYLLLETIGDAKNTDGPDGWKGSATPGNFKLLENSIVEWDGTAWQTVFDPDTVDNTTYITNLKTGVQYKWDGIQWLKSFEGEYAPGYWRFDPEGA